MFKRKRIAAGLASVLMLSALAAGCSGGAGSPAQEGAGAGKADGQPVELIWYTVGGPQKDIDKVMEAVSKYTKEKINATVKMKMIDWGDYSQKMQVISVSGEPYDIAFTSSWAFDYVQNARKGAFYEMDGLLDKYGQGIKKAVHPSFLEGSKVNGHNYGVPANKELPAQAVWRFNKKYVDKYKLDLSNVSSLESLEPLLKTMKENEPGVYPIPSNVDPFVPFDFVVQGIPFGVRLDTKDYKIVNVFETPEYRQMSETMRKYYKAGYLPPDVATKTGNDHEKTGKWLVDKSHTVPFADNLWSEGFKYEIVSKPIHEPIVFNWSVTGSMMAISANSKHPEKAMEFLNLLNSDAYLRNLASYGLEGTHYKKVSEGVIEPIPDSGYSMPSFTLGNMFLLNRFPKDPADKWEQYDKFNKSAKNAPLLGFQFDSSKVENELAAVKSVSEEFKKAFETGSVEPSEVLPKAIDKLKAAGINKVMDEAQKQLDAWRAKK
ncbi:putative aldouronate transport system substrate-binding protein [Paenibacillus tianmuensis]|uniref:Putative aldouronate transport system substrate-binding protein n=1 Tax=Paenibacillus tianmuensis TaxID=624147 RepID=A0A1G4RVR0_9BACL|nr:ABC transporter substrate-binding protein [Paenibacillus tianmuensis]SCW61053.1 putative aldouronate transport system substrate-binding protein [Paenibacillus tianmuensis]